MYIYLQACARIDRTILQSPYACTNTLQSLLVSAGGVLAPLDMSNGKVVYLCPLKALCNERKLDWERKFGHTRAPPNPAHYFSDVNSSGGGSYPPPIGLCVTCITGDDVFINGESDGDEEGNEGTTAAAAPAASGPTSGRGRGGRILPSSSRTGSESSSRSSSGGESGKHRDIITVFIIGWWW